MRVPDLILAIAQIERVFWARPLSTPAMIAVFIGVVMLSVYLYRRSWGLKPGLRVLLGVARLVVLALVVASLFEPMAVFRETHTQQRMLPVLIDVSQSMSIKDPRKLPEELTDAAVALNLLSPAADTGAADAMLNLDTKQRQAIAFSTRLDLALSLVTKSARPVLESIGQGVDVSYHAFGSKTRLISGGRDLSGGSLDELNAVEPETHIANALESVAKSGASPAGIVLLSDGIDSGSSLQAEAILQDLSARGIPVYTVPIGLTNPDDVSIRNIVMQEVAYSGDRVPVRVQLQSKGYERRMARLSVLLNDRRV